MAKKSLLIVLVFFSMSRADIVDLLHLELELSALSNIYSEQNIINGQSDAIVVFKKALYKLPGDKVDKNSTLKVYDETPNFFQILSSSYLYVYLKDMKDNLIIKGTRNKLHIFNIIGNLSSEEKISIKEKLVQNYKIHIMPKSINDLITVLARLFDALGDDEILQKDISNIKFKKFLNFNSIEALKQSLLYNKETLPIIVIYASSNKADAEYILNKLIKILEGIPGADIVPRFNIKVNDLIYYAQGDGDFKGEPKYDQYYDLTKNKALYKPDFEGPGENKDYSLKITAKP